MVIVSWPTHSDSFGDHPVRFIASSCKGRIRIAGYEGRSCLLLSLFHPMGVGEAIVNQRKKNFSGTVKSRHDAKTEAALFLRQGRLGSLRHVAAYREPQDFAGFNGVHFD